MNRMTKSATFVGAWFLLASCGEPSRVAGNSANTGNAQATGRILSPSGAPARGVWVECRPDSLSPWDPRLTGWTDLTDSTGVYRCTDLPFGRVGISATDPGSGLSRWRDDTLSRETKFVASHTDTLAKPGLIKVALPPGTNGTLFLTGLGITLPIRGEQEVEIANVPGGWKGQVKLANAVDRQSIVDTGLGVLPGMTDSAGYTRRSMKIRVTLAGKALADLQNFPLLVRFDSLWGGFDASLPDGSDIRLTDTSGKTLPCTIVSWDRKARTGTIWTMFDTLKAPAYSTDLVVSWGLPVPSAPKPADGFTKSNGWIAAWPLGDTGSTVLDRTGAFPGKATKTNSVTGVIGKASSFDGRASNILISGSTGGALALPEGGPYTISCWVRLANFGTSRFVLGRGEQGTNLKFQKTYGSDTNSWLAKDFRASPAGGYLALTKADTSVWTHLAMTVSGNAVSLYVNGIPKAVDSSFDGDKIGKRDLPFLIGAAIDTAGVTSQHFAGEIAEVWVQKTVRSSEWMRFVADNQRPSRGEARPWP